MKKWFSPIKLVPNLIQHAIKHSLQPSVKRQLGSILLITLTSLAVAIGFGQGCAKPFQTHSNSHSSSVNMNSLPPEYELNPEAPTLSLVYNKQVLDHLVACSGIGVPSDETQSTWASKRGAVSIDGTVLTITAPMLMAVTTISGDVCRDLIDKEKTSPRLFNNVNWSATSLPADGALQDAIRGLALSCWQRPEESEENQILMEAIKSQFGSGTVNPSDAMLFLCTSMLASVDTLIL